MDDVVTILHTYIFCHYTGHEDLPIMNIAGSSERNRVIDLDCKRSSSENLGLSPVKAGRMRIESKAVRKLHCGVIYKCDDEFISKRNECLYIYPKTMLNERGRVESWFSEKLSFVVW